MKKDVRIVFTRLMNVRVVGNVQGNSEFEKDKIQFAEPIPFRENVNFYIIEYKFQNDNIPLLLELTLGILIETTSDIDKKEVQNSLETVFENEFNRTIEFLQSIEKIDNDM